MSILFFVLFVFSVVGLGIGLIRPEVIIRKEVTKIREFGYRKTIALGFGSLIILFFILFAIFIEKEENKKTRLTEEQIQKAEGLLRNRTAQKQAQQEQTSQPLPSTTAPTAPAPREKLLKFNILQQFGSRTEFLLDASPLTESLKTLINKLAETHCAGQQVCVLNFYDDGNAYEQLSDFNSPIFDNSYPESEFRKIEAHFVGQYSQLLGGTVRRHRQNGQWINF